MQKIKHILEIWTNHGYGWIIDWVDNIAIEICNYEPVAASSYFKLPEELNHLRKGLINIQNRDDNKCFEWCHVRLLILKIFILKEELMKINKWKLV